MGLPVAFFKTRAWPISPSGGRTMIGTHVRTEDASIAEKARELLDRGEISAAMKYYAKSYDPEALDEVEARNMLIEARALVTRKHLLEALEAFEEALLTGTDVQRRQALEGIASVGRLRLGVPALSMQLAETLREALGETSLESIGMSLVDENENLALITPEAVSALPETLTRAGRVQRIPAHLSGESLPLETHLCVLYTEPQDLQIIKDIAVFLASRVPQSEAPPED
jgi:hypothetical protein